MSSDLRRQPPVVNYLGRKYVWVANRPAEHHHPLTGHRRDAAHAHHHKPDEKLERLLKHRPSSFQLGLPFSALGDEVPEGLQGVYRVLHEVDGAFVRPPTE